MTSNATTMTEVAIALSPIIQKYGSDAVEDAAKQVCSLMRGEAPVNHTPVLTAKPEPKKDSSEIIIRKRLKDDIAKYHLIVAKIEGPEALVQLGDVYRSKDTWMVASISSLDRLSVLMREAAGYPPRKWRGDYANEFYALIRAERDKGIKPNLPGVETP